MKAVMLHCKLFSDKKCGKSISSLKYVRLVPICLLNFNLRFLTSARAYLSPIALGHMSDSPHDKISNE